jgi:hypothetical protein
MIYRGFKTHGDPTLISQIIKRWTSCEQPLFILTFFFHPKYFSTGLKLLGDELTKELICEWACFSIVRNIRETTWRHVFVLGRNINDSTASTIEFLPCISIKIITAKKTNSSSLVISGGAAYTSIELFFWATFLVRFPYNQI